MAFETAKAFVKVYVFPFVLLRTHMAVIEEYDMVMQQQSGLIEFQNEQIASLLDQRDALEDQITDYELIKDSLPESDRYDIDQAIADMEGDGIIHPDIWRHGHHG